MAKKRQPDFAKTQLKVGRPVKKRNVTNTSFKAKKILMPSKRQKENIPLKTIPDCLKNIKSSPDKKKIEELKRLVKNERDSLAQHLSDLFDCCFNMILHTDENLRKAAADVVIEILSNTSDLQIHNFMPRFIHVLACTMTNSYRNKDNTNSLNLLKAMLQKHPMLICHSMNILTNLLQMLMESPRKSRLTTIHQDDKLSQDFRLNVLDHMNLFLEKMLDDTTTVMDQDRDEQEVYWDSENTLDLEIYASGGLQPIDIEKSYSSEFDCDELLVDDSERIEEFIDGIVNLIPAIFIEEIASDVKSDDNLYSKTSIYNLSILFQVLCRITEWTKLISYEKMDSKIKKFLQEQVYYKRRFPFGERDGNLPVGNNQEPYCVRLNLALCFLFGTFLIESEDEDLCKCIFNYVLIVFKMRYPVRLDSIPMIVKIMKIYFGCSEGLPAVSDFLRNCLTQLCNLLKGHSNSANMKLLSSLFIKISLDSAYHFLVETDAMKNWFRWILTQVFEVPKKGKVDKYLLKVIKKIANRRFKFFRKLLDGYHYSAINALLKYDDDDVRDTAIFLIYNMEEISELLLDNIARHILSDPTFPVKCSARLIRLLTHRFSVLPPKDEKIPKISLYNAKGVVHILHFILTIAIDFFNIDKLADYEANEYTKALKICKEATTYHVIPSLHWKTHSAVFDVCVKFLNQLNQKHVHMATMNMMIELLDNTRFLPMHSAIAILKLYNCEMKMKYYRLLISDVLFSTLLTISVLTHLSVDEEWYKWNVAPVMNLEISTESVLESLQHVNYISGEIDGIVVYYMLRVYKFYHEHELIHEEDYHKLLKNMDILQEKCSDPTIGQQPLFVTLYEYFKYYM